MFGSGDPFQQQFSDEYVSPYQAMLGLPPGELSATVANVLGPIQAENMQREMRRAQRRAAGQAYVPAAPVQPAKLVRTWGTVNGIAGWITESDPEFGGKTTIETDSAFYVLG